MNGKNVDWKIKTAGELILFAIYLSSGMMMGWTLALGETSLEKTASMLSMIVAFLLLWALHRRRNVFLWKIQTATDGAVMGTIIGSARAATYFVIERIVLNIYMDWLIIIGTGFVIGGVYGWLSQMHKAGK